MTVNDERLRARRLSAVRAVGRRPATNSLAGDQFVGRFRGFVVIYIVDTATPPSANPSQEARELAAEVAALIGQHSTPPLLDAGQAAVILNVPQSWVAAEARAGRIPHVRLGRYVRFSRDELIAWCDGRTVGPRVRSRRAA